MSPFDNALAVDQMEVAYDTLLSRPVASDKSLALTSVTQRLAKDGKEHPRIVRYASQDMNPEIAFHRLP